MALPRQRSRRAVHRHRRRWDAADIWIDRDVGVDPARRHTLRDDSEGCTGHHLEQEVTDDVAGLHSPVGSVRRGLTDADRNWRGIRILAVSASANVLDIVDNAGLPNVVVRGSGPRLLSKGGEQVGKHEVVDDPVGERYDEVQAASGVRTRQRPADLRDRVAE